MKKDTSTIDSGSVSRGSGFRNPKGKGLKKSKEKIRKDLDEMEIAMSPKSNQHI